MASNLRRVPDIADVPPIGFKSEKKLRKEQRKLEGMKLCHLILQLVLHPKYFIPNIPKLNKDGQKVWKTGRNGDYVETVKRYPVKAYRDQAEYDLLFDYPADKLSTEQADLANIEAGDRKKRLEKSKKFFNSKKGSLWFHPTGEVDGEHPFFSMCPGKAHYHFICPLKEGCTAAHKDEEIRNYRCDINKLSTQAEGVDYIAKSRTVDSNVGMMQYLTDGHLIHMGTLDGDLLNHVCAAQEYTNNPELPLFKNIKEDVEVSKAVPEDDPFEDDRELSKTDKEKKCDKKYGRFAEDSDNDSDSDSDEDNVGQPRKKLKTGHDIQTVAATPSQQKGNLNFQNLMALVEAYPEIRKWSTFKYKALKGELTSKEQYFVQSNLMTKNMAIFFQEALDIADEHNNQLPIDVLPIGITDLDTEDVYMTELETLDFLEKWAKKAHLPLDNLLLDTYMVLYKRIQRRNTLVLQGGATSGKSMYMKGLVIPLYERCTPQSCDGGETRFIYELPAMKRDNILLFNEFTPNIRYLERDKNVLEGTQTVIARKGIQDVEFAPRPVLIACNEQFWKKDKLTETNQKALEERCFIFQDLETIEAADWIELHKGKEINPNIMTSFFAFADRHVDSEFIQKYTNNGFKLDDSVTAELTLDNFKQFVVDLQ